MGIKITAQLLEVRGDERTYFVCIGGAQAHLTTKDGLPQMPHCFSEIGLPKVMAAVRACEMALDVTPEHECPVCHEVIATSDPVGTTFTCDACLGMIDTAREDAEERARLDRREVEMRAEETLARRLNRALDDMVLGR